MLKFIPILLILSISLHAAEKFDVSQKEENSLILQTNEDRANKIQEKKSPQSITNLKDTVVNGGLVDKLNTRQKKTSNQGKDLGDWSERTGRMRMGNQQFQHNNLGSGNRYGLQKPGVKNNLSGGQLYNKHNIGNLFRKPVDNRMGNLIGTHREKHIGIYSGNPIETQNKKHVGLLKKNIVKFGDEKHKNK